MPLITYFCICYPHKHKIPAFQRGLCLVAHIGQQRQMACAFDSLGQGALVNGTGAGHAAGQNLGALREQSSEFCNIFIIDDTARSVDAELANLFMLFAILKRSAGSF